MTLVVDASVLVALTSDSGVNGSWAEVLLSSNSLVAPDLALVEASNVLRRLEHANRLGRLEAASAFADLHAMAIEVLPFAPFADRVWELRDNLTCYDALYVAIAEAMDAPLATLDRKLAVSSGPRCAFLSPE